MKKAAKVMAGKFMGFDTAAALLAHVESRNVKILSNASEVALVYDNLATGGNPYYVLARGKTDVLLAILPDSKALVPASHRQNSGELPFIFEVLA